MSDFKNGILKQGFLKSGRNSNGPWTEKRQKNICKKLNQEYLQLCKRIVRLNTLLGFLDLGAYCSNR